jgi:tetratricopeptide (TPR) repeat protein
MSLIVARKQGNQIAIVSDTKLTYPDHEIKRQKDDPFEGVIKTIILDDDLCVSFAGEIVHAENAFLEIGKKQNFDEVIEILYRHHRISNQKTEFLVCSGKPAPFIHKIKNGESKEVNTCWIGDSKAFNSFQTNMMKTDRIKQSARTSHLESKAGIIITEMNVRFTLNMQSELFSKMSSAIDEVIEDCNVDSVGGFRVSVVYKEKFEFVKYGKFYRGNIELFGSGMHILGHGSANEGAYSINFFGASYDHNAVAIHIRQGDFGLVYSRQQDGLLRPELVRKDEVDFIDYVKEKYGITAAFATQDRIQKFIIDAKTAFDKKEYLKAKDIFDKAVKEATGNMKAELLYYKGICLLNLRDNKNAINTFKQAIDIDSSFQQRVMQTLSKLR